MNGGIVFLSFSLLPMIPQETPTCLHMIFLLNMCKMCFRMSMDEGLSFIMFVMFYIEEEVKSFRSELRGKRSDGKQW